MPDMRGQPPKDPDPPPGDPGPRRIVPEGSTPLRLYWIGGGAGPMVSAGIVILLGGVVASMAVAIYVYSEERVNLVEVGPGERFTVGPLAFLITLDGPREVDPDSAPLVGITVTAENPGRAEVSVSGGQFHLEAGGKRHQPVNMGLEGDLLRHVVGPGEQITRSTQFDVPYDPGERYDLLVRPLKEHASGDVARICLANC